MAYRISQNLSYNLKDCKWFEENSFKFGDILDTAGNRHYGYTFVGKNGLCENTTRINSINFEEGVTVPINISKYLTDTVLKYSNYDWDESCILVYELPYHDVTVQKYKVKKDHMYEYIYGFNTKKWYLEQIDIKTGERTRPTKIYKKKKVAKKDASVILLSSAAAQVGVVNHEAIAAAKAGIIGLAQSAAATYASRNLRFNCIAPGMVDTPLTEIITQNEMALKGSVAMHALGRIGGPDEIARAIAFFLSPQRL